MSECWLCHDCGFGAKPGTHYGGVGLGTIHTSLAFLTVIIALVAWVTFEGERAEGADPAQ